MATRKEIPAKPINQQAILPVNRRFEVPKKALGLTFWYNQGLNILVVCYDFFFT